MSFHEILLIDDETEVLHALERTLHEDGYHILMCKSAEEAWAGLAENPADLIICDYGLPGMNGIDFLEKTGREYPGIPAILLTGQTHVQMAVEAVNRLILKKFIVKPWNNDELRALVKELLGKRKSEFLRKIKARDIMSKFAITVTEEEALFKVAHLMMRFKISGLPVVSREGKMVGIITATDLFRIMGESVEHESAAPSYRTVGDFMTRTVCTISRESSFLEVITLMWEKNVHTLPVVEKDEIIGIIGRRDVLNQYYRLFDRFTD